MATIPPADPNFDAAKLYVWIKGVESKVNTLIREVDSLKNDYVKKYSDLRTDLKVFNDDLLELRRAENAMQQKVDLLIKEISQTAGSEEVAVLKRYVEYWNPLNFVTQKDLERALRVEKNIKGD